MSLYECCFMNYKRGHHIVILMRLGTQIEAMLHITPRAHQNEPGHLKKAHTLHWWRHNQDAIYGNGNLPGDHPYCWWRH